MLNNRCFFSIRSNVRYNIKFLNEFSASLPVDTYWIQKKGIKGDGIVYNTFILDKGSYFTFNPNKLIYGPYTKQVNDIIIAFILVGAKLIKKNNKITFYIFNGYVDGCLTLELKEI